MTDEFATEEQLAEREHLLYLSRLHMLGLRETVAIIGGDEAVERIENPPDWTRHIKFT